MKVKKVKAKGREEKRVRKLYAWLTWQPDLETAVRDLTSRSLRDLMGLLNARGVLSGIPGMVDGLITVEAARRFMNMTDSDAGGGL